jgi:hypothetical protein
MLIITGTGRCGTGMLSKLFGGFHEYEARYLLDHYFHCHNPSLPLFHSLEAKIEAIQKAHGKIESTRFVNASNLYIHFLDAIHALYPEAKVILIIRNGKDFARSAISRQWHTYREFGIVPLIDDPYYEQWESMNPFQKAAWIWTYRNRLALNCLASIPHDRQCIVRLEDCSNDETLERLETFAEINITDKNWAKRRRYNTNQTFTCPPKEEWNKATHQAFDEIAGQLMERFGYE